MWVSMVAPDQTAKLMIAADTVGQSTVLTVHGMLDTTTYLSLRDAIIKAALDEPRAVIIDVADLDVPAESAWVVFTSAGWHVGRWPEVPIMLVCAHLWGAKPLRATASLDTCPCTRRSKRPPTRWHVQAARRIGGARGPNSPQSDKPAAVP